MVTATHAIVVGKGNQKAHAAVVGMQIDYDTFYTKFFEATSTVSLIINFNIIVSF